MEYEIRKISDGIYSVAKFKENKIYSVNLNLMKCTCQGFKSWKKCKHIPMVQGYIIATEKGAPLSDTDKIKIDLAFQNVEETDFGFKCVDKIFGNFQDGIILDIETTGLDPKKDEIVTFGYIYKDSMIIFQRTKI
jgi:uncharacterized protein YprB with RNaseH-like and TPR domain